MTLIKDSKKSTVAQYIRKTLAKKRLSVEKAASSAGGGESAKSGGDAADQKKEESEKFVSLLSKVCLILHIQYNLMLSIYYFNPDTDGQILHALC